MTAALHEESRPAGGGLEFACARSAGADITTTAPAVEKREPWQISDFSLSSWVLHPGTGFADGISACLEALPLLRRLDVLFPTGLCTTIRDRPDLIPPSCHDPIIRLLIHIYGATAEVIRLLHEYTDIPNNLPPCEDDE